MNVDALLMPVAASSPCGEDLSFSIEFDQIAEMRREDDPTLDQGEWITALKVADWPGVVDTCGRLLGSRTNDLRLAMWMTEAWAMVEGYAGLGKGLRLCTELCERYWPTLHPVPDQGDVEERIGNIGWLLQRVVALSRTLPAARGRLGAFTLLDLASARQLQPALERHPDDAARLATGRVTLDQFNRALKETPAAALLDTLVAARQCRDQLLALQAVVDRHLGAEGPGFVQAKEALAEVVPDLGRLARDNGALEAGHAAPDPTGSSDGPAGWAHLLDEVSGHRLDAAPGADALRPVPPGAGPRTRAQALQQLRDVAAFFRQTEPHSPVAYLAEKAVKWGEMPLHEWLRKVVKDPGAMAHLHELLGLDDKEDRATAS